MAPLGAKAADLVVWWEKGIPEEDEAVGEIVAAFEQETGKQVELDLHRTMSIQAKVVAALEAGQPPDFLFGADEHGLFRRQWAYEDRLVDLSDAIGRSRDLFDPDALAFATLLDANTGQTRPVRAADGPLDQPRPRLEEPAGAGRLHPR